MTAVVRAWATLFSAILWVGLVEVRPAAAEICAETQYFNDGGLRSVTYTDCDSRKRIERRIFWQTGGLRKVFSQNSTVRIREKRHPDGSLASAHYLESVGLHAYFSQEKSRVLGAALPRSFASIEGLRLFATGESLTHYGPSGAPEHRTDAQGRKQPVPAAALPSPRTDNFGLSFEANYHRQVLDGRAADGVFLGDSIVSQLRGLNDPAKAFIWEALVGDHAVLNGAVSGDRVEHLLDRTWTIEPSARLVAIQIGTNNHKSNGLDADPSATAEGIARLVAETQRIARQAKIVLIAIPPTTDPIRHEKNLVTNQLIAVLADEGRVLFVDGGAEFDPADLGDSPDGLHQTSEGALKWFGPLVPIFRWLLAEDP